MSYQPSPEKLQSFQKTLAATVAAEDAKIAALVARIAELEQQIHRERYNTRNRENAHGRLEREIPTPTRENLIAWVARVAAAAKTLTGIPEYLPFVASELGYVMLAKVRKAKLGGLERALLMVSNQAQTAMDDPRIGTSGGHADGDEVGAPSAGEQSRTAEDELVATTFARYGLGQQHQQELAIPINMLARALSWAGSIQKKQAELQREYKDIKPEKDESLTAFWERTGDWLQLFS